MISVFHNKINAFLMVTLAGLFAGCFRPETSLTYKSDESGFTQSQGSQSAGQVSLDRRTEWSVEKYGATVQKYANKYDLDWKLVVAVMRHESRFDEDAVSEKGALGLMQLMPATQSELAGKLGVEETSTPSNNIRVGVYHLQELYRSIDSPDEDNHLRLTLAAYNAGLNRVLDAQDIASFLGDDPKTWSGVKRAFPLLSKRYQDLHRNIWSSGRPRAAYFIDWRQTVQYVESVMGSYSRYQVALK